MAPQHLTGALGQGQEGDGHAHSPPTPPQAELTPLLPKRALPLPCSLLVSRGSLEVTAPFRHKLCLFLNPEGQDGG